MTPESSIKAEGPANPVSFVPCATSDKYIGLACSAGIVVSKRTFRP